MYFCHVELIETFTIKEQIFQSIFLKKKSTFNLVRLDVLEM